MASTASVVQFAALVDLEAVLSPCRSKIASIHVAPMAARVVQSLRDPKRRGAKTANFA